MSTPLLLPFVFLEYLGVESKAPKRAPHFIVYAISAYARVVVTAGCKRCTGAGRRYDGGLPRLHPRKPNEDIPLIPPSCSSTFCRSATPCRGWRNSHHPRSKSKGTPNRDCLRKTLSLLRMITLRFGCLLPPSRRRCLAGDLGALFWGELCGAGLAALLSTLAADPAHVFGQINLNHHSDAKPAQERLQSRIDLLERHNMRRDRVESRRGKHR